MTQPQNNNNRCAGCGETIVGEHKTSTFSNPIWSENRNSFVGWTNETEYWCIPCYDDGEEEDEE